MVQSGQVRPPISEETSASAGVVSSGSLTVVQPSRPLTERQQQVVDLYVIQGLTYRQTAERLGLSPETINPVLKQVMHKFGSKKISRAALKAALEVV